jgi:hypothetical protein
MPAGERTKRSGWLRVESECHAAPLPFAAGITNPLLNDCWSQKGFALRYAHFIAGGERAIARGLELN